MNNRERILAVLDGRKPDRIPWAPRLKLWYKAHSIQGTLPEEYRGLELDEVEQKLNGAAGSTARFGSFKEFSYNKVEVSSHILGSRRIVRYETPVGSVEKTYKFKKRAADRGLPFEEHVIEYPIRSKEDYNTVEYIFKDIHFDIDYEEYRAFEKNLGDRGVPIVELHWDPMFYIMRELIGLNKFYYELSDHQKRVEELYTVLCDTFGELRDLVVESPARIILAALHYDYRTVPPYLYRKYMQPYLQPFAEKLKAKNKIMGLHADADLKELVGPLHETGFEFMDCFVCAPMVSLSLGEALEVWRDDIVLYGCIPSNLLVPALCPEEVFKEYMESTMKTIESNPCRVILGVADNVMPEADIQRVEYIADMVVGEVKE